MESSAVEGSDRLQSENGGCSQRAGEVPSADCEHTDHEMLLLTELNVPLMDVPKAEIAVAQTATIRANITPYRRPSDRLR